MRGENKENILSEKILAEVIADDIKANQKSLIDSSSCNKPERKVKDHDIWHLKFEFYDFLYYTKYVRK